MFGYQVTYQSAIKVGVPTISFCKGNTRVETQRVRVLPCQIVITIGSARGSLQSRPKKSLKSSLRTCLVRERSPQLSFASFHKSHSKESLSGFFFRIDMKRCEEKLRLDGSSPASSAEACHWLSAPLAVRGWRMRGFHEPGRWEGEG